MLIDVIVRFVLSLGIWLYQLVGVTFWLAMLILWTVIGIVGLFSTPPAPTESSLPVVHAIDGVLKTIQNLTKPRR